MTCTNFSFSSPVPQYSILLHLCACLAFRAPPLRRNSYHCSSLILQSACRAIRKAPTAVLPSKKRRILLKVDMERLPTQERTASNHPLNSPLVTATEHPRRQAINSRTAAWVFWMQIYPPNETIHQGSVTYLGQRQIPDLRGARSYGGYFWIIEKAVATGE